MLVGPEKVQLQLLIPWTVQQSLVEVVRLEWVRLGIWGAEFVLPLDRREAQEFLANNLPFLGAVALPVRVQRTSELCTKAFLVDVAILRDDGADCAGPLER